MKYLRAVKGCSLRDRLRNDNIRKYLKLQSILDRKKEYRQNWISNVERMVDTRTPKQAIEYSQWEREIVEDPGENGWRLCEVGTGLAQAT